MIIQISGTKRQRLRELYDETKNIHQQIQREVEAQYRAESKGYQNEIEILQNELREFRNDFSKYFIEFAPKPGQKIKVQTQTGPGGSVLKTYVGTLVSFHRNLISIRHFNMICPEKNDGKPFTVGVSCLAGFEFIVDEDVNQVKPE